MKALITFLFLLLANNAYGSFDQYFRGKTLRMDYFRSGDYENEIVSFDELIEEGDWAGSKTNLIDTLDLGIHKFEVFDVATGQIIFSRGYCSLFNEWQTTDEAQKTWRTFGETIILPFPKASIEVIFYTRSRTNVWKKLFEYSVDPSDKFISRERKAVYTVMEVNVVASADRALDVVFLPEGYTENQLQKFIADCFRFAGYLLKSDAFAAQAGKINIRAVLAPSKEPGTDIPGQNIWRQTILNSNFYTFGSERYLTTMDVKSARNLAANAPYEQIVIIVNSPKYGGGGIYNYYSVATSDNNMADYVFIHEFGHAFTGLGDEYYSSEVAYVDYYDLKVEPWEPNLTTLVNFEKKWKDMLDPGTPIPTPAILEFENKVGVFEGGGYTAKGVYRPFVNCTMKDLKYNAFCPACTKAINQMIDFVTK